MKTFLFIAALFAMFIITIVFAYKPSMLEKQYNKIAEPIKEHLAESQTEAWRVAKDEQWKIWSKNHKLPVYCANPDSSIHELECKNQRQLQADTFERVWAGELASGWKPAGVN